jgi:predicted RNA polymerase sigma factor
MSEASRAVDVFRAEHAQVFAALWRRLGEFDLVDAALADAYLAASASWPATGVPQNPMSWMSTVAMSATTSVLSKRGGDVPDPATPVEDVRTMLFACCHPALTPDERVVCLVRAAVGLMPHEIASLLGVPEATVASRLNAAKRALRQPGAGFVAIPDAQRPDREQLVRDTAAAASAAGKAKSPEAASVRTILDTRLAQAFA